MACAALVDGLASGLRRGKKGNGPRELVRAQSDGLKARWEGWTTGLDWVQSVKGLAREGKKGERAELGLGLFSRFLGLVSFLFFYSISKTNKESLNSNTNLNSNHTQIIKTMHQHECNTKI